MKLENSIRIIGRVFVMIVIAAETIFIIMLIAESDYHRHKSEPARIDAARAQISIFGTALGAYQADTGEYPDSINGLNALMYTPRGVTNWHGPYLEKEVPLDPWGRPYSYKCPGIHNTNTYDIFTTNGDGQVVGNWKGR